MKRKIKITAGFAGVLPVGNFANMRPSFGAEMEYEAEFGTQEEISLAIEAGQQELQGICYTNFEAEALKAKIMKVKEDLKDFRFHKDPITDEEFPSVSSVNNYDKIFYFATDEDLKIYAAQGNIIDAEIRNFVKTGVYTESKDLIECTADRFILKSKATSKGKMLALSGWNFRGFIEKYPIEELKSLEGVYFSRKHRTAGTPDLIGKYQGLKTLVSIKRTESETDNFTQEGGYSLCEGLEDVEQFMVVEMKAAEDGGNKQGFASPCVTKDIARYRELFLRKRSEVLKIYGV